MKCITKKFQFINILQFRYQENTANQDRINDESSKRSSSQARDFALAEIIKLTDSYRDMKINKVISAETARSVFVFF